jgi:hypothetical protein
VTNQNAESLAIALVDHKALCCGNVHPNKAPAEIDEALGFVGEELGRAKLKARMEDGRGEARMEKAKTESDQRNPQSSILVLEISAVCRDPSVPSRVFAATAQGATINCEPQILS